MAYGLSTRVFVENGPFEQVARLQSARSTARSWHTLNSKCRLAIVEQALRAANDELDEFPFAL